MVDEVLGGSVARVVGEEVVVEVADEVVVAFDWSVERIPDDTCDTYQWLAVVSYCMIAQWC